jgi:hypothetical protein
MYNLDTGANSSPGPGLELNLDADLPLPDPRLFIQQQLPSGSESWSFGDLGLVSHHDVRGRLDLLMNDNTQAIPGPDQELLHQGDSEGYEFSASQTEITARLQRLDAYLTFVKGTKADDSPATSDSDLPIPSTAGDVSSSSLPFVSSQWYVNTSLIQDHGSCVSRNQ